MSVDDRMRRAFVKAVGRAEEEQFQIALLGNSSGVVEVQGRRGYVHIKLGSTITIARNEGSVPLVVNQVVKVKRVSGTYVVVGVSTNPNHIYPSISPSSGVSSHPFTDHSDVPSSYTGAAGKTVAVNAGATGLEFVTGGGGGGSATSELEWLYVGGGQITDYGNNYVGWNTEAAKLDGEGGWGAIVIEDTDQYYNCFAIVKDRGINGYTDVLALNPGSIYVSGYDNGAGGGATLFLGRNTNPSTPGASSIVLVSINAAESIWIDAAKQLRITTNQTSVNYTQDLFGVVVGTQTSSLDTKEVLGDAIPPAEALAHIVAAAQQAVKRFRYKQTVEGDERSRPFRGEEFNGIVTDYADRYGMDKDEEHPAGKSLNVITVIGDLMLSVTALTARVEELEKQFGGA